MDIEHILRTLNSHGVEYIALGGKDFLPNPAAPLTCDLGAFVEDTPANRTELNFALQELGCHSSPSENVWKPVEDNHEWLEQKVVHALTCPHGTLTIFRVINGLDDGFDACKARASIRSMQDGEMYYSLGDEDLKKVSGF